MSPAQASISARMRHFHSDFRLRPRTVAATEGGTSRREPAPFFQELCIEIRRRPPVFDRATTSLTDLPLVASPRPRVKSARFAAPGMPRSHVGVARFYDWSDHPADCYPVSRLYREIACTPRLPPRVSGQTASPATAHAVKISLSPGRPGAAGQGRMFFREKKALTRGEKEIIEGIYRNRGDASARRDDDSSGNHESSLIKSHQDAWHGDKSVGNVGLSRVWLKGERIDAKHPRANAAPLHAKRPPTSSTDTPQSSSTESLALPVKASRKGPPTTTKPPSGPVLVSTCLTCQTLKDDYASRGVCLDSGPAAPPSSPDLLLAAPRHRSKAAPTFDKLLSSRPSLPPTSILLADRLAALNLDTGQFPYEALGDIYEETNNNFDNRAYNLYDNYCPDILTKSHDCLKTLPETINADALVGTASWILQCDKKDADLGQPEVEQRKFAVQIYVPTAGPDQPDDESPQVAGNSIAKERPLSHRTFKRKKKT